MSDDFGSGAFGAKQAHSTIDPSRRDAPAMDAPAEQALDVIEVSGRIKWFDVAKGFGFVVPDNGMPDVLLHVTCLRRDGYQTANEGAQIVVEAVPRPPGLQALRIVPPDQSRATQPSELPDRKSVGSGKSVDF